MLALGKLIIFELLFAFFDDLIGNNPGGLSPGTEQATRESTKDADQTQQKYEKVPIRRLPFIFVA